MLCELFFFKILISDINLILHKVYRNGPHK